VSEAPETPVVDLIRQLESADAFERREAQAELSRRTLLEFGYRWNDPEDVRAEAVSRWKVWLRARGGRSSPSARKPSPKMSIHGAVADLDQIKNALMGIPPDQLEAHLASILKKMEDAEATRRRCQSCGVHRAIIHVTDIAPEGDLSLRDLCERCAAEEGELPSG
jgi:ribosomal protein S14